MIYRHTEQVSGCQERGRRGEKLKDTRYPCDDGNVLCLSISKSISWL